VKEDVLHPQPYNPLSPLPLPLFPFPLLRQIQNLRILTLVNLNKGLVVIQYFHLELLNQSLGKTLIKGLHRLKAPKKDA
jgi:hypothetical protein